MYNDIVIFLNKKLKNSVVVNTEEETPPQLSYQEGVTDLGVINLNGYVTNLYRQVFSVDLEEDTVNSYPLEYEIWWAPTMKLMITDNEGNFYNHSICGSDNIINNFYFDYNQFLIDTTGITWPEGKSYTAYVILDFYYYD